jgi:dihydroorotase
LRAGEGRPMSSLLIRGGRVVDPASGIDGHADVLVEEGVVKAVGRVERTAARIVDADGLVVAPGLIDVHVHLREPGFIEKETIATGSAAAAAGGFTTVFCMPNTNPALDSVETLRALDAIIRRDAVVRVHPIAAITKGRRGEEAVDFDALAAAGAVGFSDDGDSTADSGIMRAALAATRRHGRPVMTHCEDRGLTGGAMHEGDISLALGIAGIPAEAEEIVIARDLALARLTGGWLHLCHVSIGTGVDLLRRFKAAGTRATGEAMPHHLVMTDEWVVGSRRMVNVDEPAGAPGTPRDPHTKVNPPLRPQADAAALLAGVRDGTIDLVATDHAPHVEPEKAGSTFERAAFGMIGSELALPTMLALVRAGQLSPLKMIDLLSAAPARLWNLPTGRLTPGAPADIVLFDPAERWTVSRDTLRSKSINTPLLGMTLQGKVKRTFVAGEERYVDA